MAVALSQNPAGGEETHARVHFLAAHTNYQPEDYGLEVVELSPTASIYQLAEPDRYRLMQDGRLISSIQPELEIPTEEDTSLLSAYLTEIHELESWVTTRALPSINALIELARTSYKQPSMLKTVFEKHLSRIAKYTPITRRKIASLRSWCLAGGVLYAGSVSPMDIVHSLSFIPKEIEQHYKTLQTLNERFTKLLEDGQPRNMSYSLYRGLQMALIDSRGLIHDIINVVQAVSGYTHLALHPLGQDNPRSSLELLFTGLSNFTYSNVSLVFNLVKTLSSTRAERRGVYLMDLENNIPELEIPEDLRFGILRAISELLLNSIKYADPAKPPHRMIWKELLAEDQVRHVRVRTDMKGSMLNIYVKDNGVGISDIKKAFEPKKRLRPDLANGTGNGLPGIKSLARSMGGDLTGVSTLGVGTEMQFSVDTSSWNRPKSHGGIGDKRYLHHYTDSSKPTRLSQLSRIHPLVLQNSATTGICGKANFLTSTVAMVNGMVCIRPPFLPSVALLMKPR